MLFTIFRALQRPKTVRSYSVAELKREHKEGTESTALHGMVGSDYVGDFVFGGIDGVITTFAVVAGVAGASLSPAVVLILGISNLLADGFSMGVGNFLSIRSEKERYDHEWEEELYEIEHIPDEERKEIREIYRNKGFEGEALEHAVNTITADKHRWAQEMMYEELGLSADTRSPFRGGIVTYLAFVLIGFIPLLSYVLAFFWPALSDHTFVLSIVLTACALFTIGALKTLVMARSFWRSGLETLLMGGLAAIVAYVVGFLLRGLV